MITEDYVSPETAMLLKEKGFDWEVHRSYLVNDNVFIPGDINDVPLRKDAIRIPTLQMAMKWLREVHKIYMYVAHDGMENTWFARVYNDYKTLSDVDNHSTYEEACEAAIKCCLENLI